LTPSERVYLSVPHMGGLEESYVADAFRSNWLSTVGPNLDGFESEMAGHLGNGVRALAVSSGTAALHLLLRYLGIGSGDHVAVSTLTFVGSVFPVLYLGAQPVFLDSEEVSGNMDPNVVEDYFKLAEKRGKLPRALIAVHLYGQHADIDAIHALCERHGVVLVEDAAESLGATYRGRPTATTAPFAMLSFNGNKIITTTSGGMVLARDEAAIATMRKWANQSREPALEYLHTELGYNYRMSNVLAGIGRGQLQVLPSRVDARRRIAERYRAAFADDDRLYLQHEASWGTHSRWLSVMFVAPDTAGCTPTRIIDGLAAENIEARPVWRPMHTQPLFNGAEVVGGAIAERLYRTGVCLPSSSNMTGVTQDRVIAGIRRCLDAS
jgi:pyridoxal phosphate-dependent aminotransferase EpsN